MALKVKYKPKQVTNISRSETGEQWECQVDYRVWNRADNHKIAQYKNKACYWGICGEVISYVQDKPESLSDIMVHYDCKRSLLAVRLPILEFICRRFSHFFAEVEINISDKGEAYVEARCKPTTPVEVLYVFGAFLRLTWEQYLDKQDTTDPVRYVMQAASHNYEIHVPFNFFFSASQVSNFENYFLHCTEEDKRDLLAILFKMLRYRKVFPTHLKTINKATNATPYVQLKFYNAMRNNPYFAKRFPDLHAKYGDHDKAVK